MKRNKIIAITILVAVIIIGVILAVVFGSAKKQTNMPTTTPEQTTTVTETTTADPNAGKVISKLTGEYVKKSIANKRPVALMYNNIINAIPHSGLYNADVCYEAPVEGSITELWAFLKIIQNSRKWVRLEAAEYIIVPLQMSGMLFTVTLDSQNMHLII